MDRYLQGIDLLDRIDELTKEVTADQKNGWRPLLLACKDEIQRSVDVDSISCICGTLLNARKCGSDETYWIEVEPCSKCMLKRFKHKEH